MLSAEISTIYKKGERTRKVHNVILAPDFISAGTLNAALQERGNIKSDGRPILGMDSKILLQLVLDASPENILIPAHIWTPHFSVLGAASGFDAVEECFEELTPQIFALETGLSSDPAMNWRVSRLDPFVLVSNSDAHSAEKLGREANIFDSEISYFAMRDALQKKDQSGSWALSNFSPRRASIIMTATAACSTCMSPEETRSSSGLCPACGKKVTVGVMHRVALLSDREAGCRPQQTFPFLSRIPLSEVLAERCTAWALTARRSRSTTGSFWKPSAMNFLSCRIARLRA